MGKFVNNIEEFFTYCKENEVAFVDFRFTDIIGAWHHITYNFHSINEETFELGIPFDGSSLEGWQPVNKSDMILNLTLQAPF